MTGLRRTRLRHPRGLNSPKELALGSSFLLRSIEEVRPRTPLAEQLHSIRDRRLPLASSDCPLGHVIESARNRLALAHAGRHDPRRVAISGGSHAADCCTSAAAVKPLRVCHPRPLDCHTRPRTTPGLRRGYAGAHRPQRDPPPTHAGPPPTPPAPPRSNRPIAGSCSQGTVVRIGRPPRDLNSNGGQNWA